MHVTINDVVFVTAPETVQSERVVKAYEYYKTCIATKNVRIFGFLSEARNGTPNLTACCTNVPIKNIYLASRIFTILKYFYPKKRSLRSNWYKSRASTTRELP